MKDIHGIILTFSKDEKKDFLNKQKQKNLRSDAKNILLFQLLDHPTIPHDIKKRLYPNKSEGAFHALCKRLQDNLIDFIATQSFDQENSELLLFQKLIFAAKNLLERKQYKIAFKTLAKAEKKALKNNFYEILNEILLIKITHTHLLSDCNLNNLIKDFETNKKLLLQEEKMTLFYASFQYQLKNNHETLTQSLDQSLDQFGISINKNLTFSSLHKILDIINQSSTMLSDYNQTLPFVEKILLQLQQASSSQGDLYDHIYILYYIANSYFRNKDFSNSMKYLMDIEKLLKLQNGKYHKQFFPQFVLLKALNYNYNYDYKKALDLLENFDLRQYPSNNIYLLDLQLTQCIIYMQQSDYKKASAILKDFRHSDNWYIQKQNMIWTIHKNLVEIILHIELNHFDLVESRLKSFRKKFGSFLKKNEEIRVLDFLSLIHTYFLGKNEISKENLLHQTETKLIQKSKQEEDIFAMSFYGWFKAKLLKKHVYNTTLEIIQKTKSTF